MHIIMHISSIIKRAFSLLMKCDIMKERSLLIFIYIHNIHIHVSVHLCFTTEYF